MFRFAAHAARVKRPRRDGDVRVEKDGVDLLDLIQERALV
jgi:hypothetical protein